jgi:endothelin-converting enzyme
MGPECIVLAGSVIASLDTTQDPCEDFYEFASKFRTLLVLALTDGPKDGGWIDSHPIPLGGTSSSVADEASRQNKQTFEYLLRTLRPAHPADSASLAKIRDLFNSCMNEDALNTMGMAPLLEVVRNVRHLFKSGAHLTADAQQTMGHTRDVKHNITSVLAYLHSLGTNHTRLRFNHFPQSCCAADIDALFSFVIRPDAGLTSGESDPDMLWLLRPKLGLGFKVRCSCIAILFPP